MAAISTFGVTQHSQICSLFLKTEFNALHFINYTIPRLCSTYAVATIGNTKGVLDSVFSFSYGIYLQGLQSKLQSGYAVLTTLELVGNAVINFCHDHPPPAHPRGFALKTLPHSGAFAS